MRPTESGTEMFRISSQKWEIPKVFQAKIVIVEGDGPKTAAPGAQKLWCSWTWSARDVAAFYGSREPQGREPKGFEKVGKGRKDTKK